MEKRNIYMVGVGGIGMSALARWFAAEGKSVAGYDRTATPLTDALKAEGIEIHFEDEVAQIPRFIKENKEDTLVVYTPAIAEENQELGWLREQGFEVVKRSVALGKITQNHFTIAVAGTHGKTTTSSMIAHILKEADVNFVAFLGGVTANYGSNLIMNQAEGELVVVVEADEYDRSFLTLNPDIAVVTAVEPDHLDIYEKENALEEAFSEFIGKLKGEGVLMFNHRVPEQVLSQLQPQVEVRSYGIDAGDFKAENWEMAQGKSHFDVVVDDDANAVTDFTLGMPGYYNSENAVAAIAVGLSLGLLPEQIQQGMASYRGVKRRFEYRINQPGCVYVDDYAHHPTEVRAFLESMKALYPEQRLTVVFQPHLFSRTQDFAQGFAESLSLADELLLMDIYPAREKPIPGVTSKMVFDKVKTEHKFLVKAEELLSKLELLHPEVLVTVGAGNIDRWVGLIQQLLESRNKAEKI